MLCNVVELLTVSRSADTDRDAGRTYTTQAVPEKYYSAGRRVQKSVCGKIRHHEILLL